jgi:hypothetical protein
MAVIAAAVIPTVNPVNMRLVMILMIVLYFICIGLVYIAYHNRDTKQKEALDKVKLILSIGFYLFTYQYLNIKGGIHA